MKMKINTYLFTKDQCRKTWRSQLGKKSRMQALQHKHSLLCKFPWKFLKFSAQFEEVTIVVIPLFKLGEGLNIFTDVAKGGRGLDRFFLGVRVCYEVFVKAMQFKNILKNYFKKNSLKKKVIFDLLNSDHFYFQ